MGHCLFMRKGETHTAPISGILLSDIAEGSIVKLNEGGTPTEFYVACHNYESALNGEGRTLLVRKDCYDIRQWHSSAINSYATSDIDAWLNGDYKKLLDEVAQNSIATTKFYYTIGNGDTTVTTLERSVFMLSITELGYSGTSANTEGNVLPAVDKLTLKTYCNGSAVAQMTRSPYISGTKNTWAFYNRASNTSCIATNGSRPCFTLPSTALFDTNTLILKGVA